MPQHSFSKTQPQVIVPVTPPPGATALLLAFSLTPPSDWTHPVDDEGQKARIRLLHFRRAGVSGPPKNSEIFELVLTANGQLVCELDGFGPRRQEHKPPQKLGSPTGDYRIRHRGGDGTVTIESSAAAAADTHLGWSPGMPLELVFGFEGQGDLQAPLGWTLSWGEGAIRWEGAGPTPQPTPQPQPTPEPTPVPVPTPQPTPVPVPQPPPGTDPKDALVADLKALLLRYAAAQGIDPLLLLTLRLLVERFGKK